jgi:glutamate receptor, ionotropic, invertebrate
MWWFFTLIMVSSYTANLAAFLTIESLSSPIDNVVDLANADGAIPYGAKRGGSTFGFFKESENPIYQKMYEYMSRYENDEKLDFTCSFILFSLSKTSHPEHMTGSNDEGLERAKAGKYAYMMESSSIEYIIERNCEVTQVGGELDAKGYGIAMKKSLFYHSQLMRIKFFLTLLFILL